MRTPFWWRAAAGLMIGAAVTPLAARAEVGVGQPAPGFALPDQTGTVHRLSDYRGKIVVLAFYPKDMTPG